MGKSPKKKKPKRKPSAYNRHVGREMRAGRTMKQAAASWKNKGSKKSSPKKKTGKSNPKGGTRNVTKNSFNMSKIYGLVRKGALAAPGIAIAMHPHWDIPTKINQAIATYTGCRMWENGKFYFEDLRRGWEPFFWANVVTHGVPRVIGFFKGLLR